MKPLGKFGCIALLLAANVGAWAQSAAPSAVTDLTATPSTSAAVPVPVLAPNSIDLPPPPSPRVPFTSPAPDTAENAGVTEAIVAGQSALGIGVASVAVDCFQDALNRSGLDQSIKDLLHLNLATAYLALGDAAKAAAALNAIAENNTPAYLLRDTLLKEQNQKWDDAAAQLARIMPASLNALDLSWYYMAQATLSEQQHNLTATNEAWNQAIAAAANPLQQGQFEASRLRAQILLDPAAAPTHQADLEKSLQDPNLDSALGAKDAGLLAVIYDQQGRRGDALALIRKKLMLVDLDRQTLDALRLEYVIIDQEEPDPANLADDQDKLKSILNDVPDSGAPDSASLRQLQEIALAQLQHIVPGIKNTNPDGLATLKASIDKIVNDASAHPLLKQLYLLQTQLDLALQKYPEATVAAQHILDLPAEPGHDPAREGAWRTLAIIAWNAPVPKYRDAVSNLSALHAALPGDINVTELLADLYFLIGDASGDPDDYLHAADYYQSLLNDPSAGQRGTHLVRAVESELKANKLDEASALLDAAVARYNDIPAMDRWKAEYNVLWALRGHDRVPEAFNRVAHLLDANHGLDLLPIALRLRLLWLDADLAVTVDDANAAEKAKVFEGEAEKAQQLPDLDLDAKELAANGLLLQMQAAAKMNDPKAELGFYDILEAKDGFYVNSDAAVYAQFIIAHELAALNRYAEAQKLMENLADTPAFKDFNGPISQAPPGAEYAPSARYEAAMDAVSLNRNGPYTEALGLLKQFVDDYAKNPLYAGSSLIYNVRYEQGLLELSSNDYSAAYDYFSNLLGLLKGKPLSDTMYSAALIARAMCLVAMAAESDGDLPTGVGGDSAAKRQAEMQDKRNVAMSELEDLFNKTQLVPVAHVQAGVLLGHLQAEDETNPDSAMKAAIPTYYQIFNSCVVSPNDTALAVDRDPDGRYWVARCCYELGHLLEKLDRRDEARIIYQQTIDRHLSQDYDKTFQDLIDTLHAPAASTAVQPAPAPPSATQPAAIAPAPAPAPAPDTNSGNNPGP